ncbi:hypothetical protein [Photobacterium damselae]|uniref:hypothetical protein n=1 Tax=Photobacterium damselae TaxID=38293 RepID=UPI0035A91DDC
MNKKMLSLILISSASLTGCSFGNNSNNVDKFSNLTHIYSSDGNILDLPINTAFTNLSTPESVTLYKDDVYITNIGGDPGNSIGLGYIQKNNNIIIKDLDDPKGMVIFNNGKYGLLSDHPNVKLIDLINNKVIYTLKIKDSKFLNDTVLISNNTFLVSDTGNGNIYRVDFNEEYKSISYSIMFTESQLGGNGINGMAFDSNTNMLYLVTSSFGGNTNQGHIYEVRLNEDYSIIDNIEKWSNAIIGNGNLDGIIIRDNYLIISDWEKGEQAASIRIFNINSKKELYRISGNFKSAADININKDSILLIPEFTENKVSTINLKSILI